MLETGVDSGKSPKTLYRRMRCMKTTLEATIHYMSHVCLSCELQNAHVCVPLVVTGIRLDCLLLDSVLSL